MHNRQGGDNNSCVSISCSTFLVWDDIKRAWSRRNLKRRAKILRTRHENGIYSPRIEFNSWAEALQSVIWSSVGWIFLRVSSKNLWILEIENASAQNWCIQSLDTYKFTLLFNADVAINRRGHDLRPVFSHVSRFNIITRFKKLYTDSMIIPLDSL